METFIGFLIFVFAIIGVLSTAKKVKKKIENKLVRKA